MRTNTLLATLAFTIAFMMPGGLAWSPDVEPPLDPTHMFVGPYAGVLEGGYTAVEHYQNAPDGAICVAIVQPYTVTIATTPPGVPVRVSVDSHTTVSTGTGSLAFERGVCTHFHIDVENLGEDPVAYAMHVASGPLAAPGMVCDGCIATT